VVEPIERVVIDRLEKPLQSLPEPAIRCERVRIQPPRERPRPAPSANDNAGFAKKIWTASVPLPGTLGETYFVEHRGIVISNLGDLSHSLRWNERIRAVVGLMTDPISNVATGVHRILLDRIGAKTERKMLGRQGVVRLSPDEDVIYGLGLAEGIEDALAILASGWSPIWAATSAGSIARFPVLNGIDALTIFSDADRVGYDAARACGDRWRSADKEAAVLPPPLNGGAQQ
jgi:putative DNA primase/helicase